MGELGRCGVRWGRFVGGWPWAVSLGVTQGWDVAGPSALGMWPDLRPWEVVPCLWAFVGVTVIVGDAVCMPCREFKERNMAILQPYHGRCILALSCSVWSYGSCMRSGR